MNIYRHKKNRRLYTLAKVSPRMYTGHWFEAIPYNHNVLVYPRKKHVDLNEFTLIAEC